MEAVSLGLQGAILMQTGDLKEAESVSCDKACMSSCTYSTQNGIYSLVLFTYLLITSSLARSSPGEVITQIPIIQLNSSYWAEKTHS